MRPISQLKTYSVLFVLCIQVFGYVSGAVDKLIILNRNEVLSHKSAKIATRIVSGKDNPGAFADPFLPYLTGQAPQIAKEMGEETASGVRIRKLIFHSYDYKSESGLEQAQIFAAVVRPKQPGNYPGLLVLHGGGGNAEIDKAKKWAAQGYVVVVLDEPGVASPEKIPFSQGPWVKYKYGENRFVTQPDITSSTIFSAVLASVQGLYLLHAQPDVIKDKIGIVGISWGGYLTTIVSGLANPMIKASFSVFGCGFFDDGSVFLKNLETMKTAERALWLKYLDAGRRAAEIKTPFFIAAAANDNWFYPPAVTNTLKNIKGQVNHLFSPNNSHKIDLPGGTVDEKSEQPGWLSMEKVYFDYYLKGIGQPLPKIQKIKTEKQTSGDWLVRFRVASATPLTSGQVSYSQTEGDWPKRKWKTIQATDSGNGWYEARIPSPGLSQSFECFATISDTRPVSVSSYLVGCDY